MSHVELQELRRSFGDFEALKGINVTLETGEFLSLLGPSGCGKTTALRLVAGFDRPTSGRVVGADLLEVSRCASDYLSGNAGAGGRLR